MSLCNISFGRKIPVAKCVVKDVQKNKYVQATISELDCRDESDIDEIEKLDSNWKYRNVILRRVEDKVSRDATVLCKSHFYIMENDNGDTIGISHTENNRPCLVLNYLEAKSGNQYKYVGQNMLSYLSKYALESGLKKIYVPIPVFQAQDFYVKKCGFRFVNNDDCALELSRFGMKRLLQKVRKRENSVNQKGFESVG